MTGLLSFGSPAAAQQPVVDGCTAVPDRGLSFDFTEACNDHDRCYFFEPLGGGETGRSACDNVFYQDMLSSCRAMWPQWYQGVARAVCNSVAFTYFLGVRSFGGLFF